MTRLPSYQYTYKNRIRALMERLRLDKAPAEDWLRFWFSQSEEERKDLLDIVK